ncbi:MAG: hypothetical protein SGI71_04100 [Verrucomicrobiota bacterium]|nr:hypothetical protein [Verrucomicrobiota bacterium]
MRRPALLAIATFLTSLAVVLPLLITRVAEPIDLKALAWGQPKPNAQMPVYVIPVEDNRLNLALLVDAMTKRPPKVFLITHPLHHRSAKQPEFDYILSDKIQTLPNVLLFGEVKKTKATTEEIQASVRVDYLSEIKGPLYDVPEVEITTMAQVFFLPYGYTTLVPVDALRSDDGEFPIMFKLKGKLAASLPMTLFLRSLDTQPTRVSGEPGGVLKIPPGYGRSEADRFLPVNSKGMFIFPPAPAVYSTIDLDLLLAESNVYEPGVNESPLLEKLSKGIVITVEPKTLKASWFNESLSCFQAMLAGENYRFLPLWEELVLSIVMLGGLSVLMNRLLVVGRVILVMINLSVIALVTFILVRMGFLWHGSAAIAGLLVVLIVSGIFESILPGGVEDLDEEDQEKLVPTRGDPAMVNVRCKLLKVLERKVNAKPKRDLFDIK